MEEYKTKALPSDNQFLGDGTELFRDLSECFYYTSEDDRRRPPIIKIPIPICTVAAGTQPQTPIPPSTDITVQVIESSADPTTPGPSETFIEAKTANGDLESLVDSPTKKEPKYRWKIAYNHYHQELDPGGCQNDYEYLYHPMNFKVTQCSALNYCTRSYCPNYHSATEREVAIRVQEEIIRQTGYQYGNIQTQSPVLSGADGTPAPALCKDGANSSDSEVETGCSSINEAHGLFVEFQLQVKFLRDLTEELEVEYQADQRELKEIQAIIAEDLATQKKTNNAANQQESDHKTAKSNGEGTKDSPSADKETYQLSRMNYPRFKHGSNFQGKKNKLGKQLILNDFKPSGSADASQQTTQYFINQEVKSFENINTEFKNFSHLDVSRTITSGEDSVQLHLRIHELFWGATVLWDQ